VQYWRNLKAIRTPVHVKLEEKYKTEIELPWLESRRRELKPWLDMKT